MKLYHGTNLDIEKIELSKCRPYKDFGTGFYPYRDRGTSGENGEKGIQDIWRRSCC